MIGEMKKQSVKVNRVSLEKSWDLVQQFGIVQGKLDGIQLAVNELRDHVYKQNGRITKLEEKTDKMQNNESFQAGKRKGAWAFYMVLGAVVTAIIGVLTFLAQAGFIAK